MHKIAILVVLIVLISASGCNSSQITLIPPISDGKKSYQQFISSNSFPYSIQEERKIQITKNYEKIKIGMTKQEVTLILGEPDFSEYLHTKENPSKYIGSEWTYYFYKPDSKLVNEKLDKGVFIFFGTTDKADWIIPKNIEGFAEKGGPPRKSR